ncbi:class I SAM-dependent methyltransferase [Shewanella avicenniae]|uniref:Class I SAM-dependent methyltransferase n=1 Tax=Shewanella avicenniae TaxID=2814294 RepID=A0ABX7QUP5_9GAMM|nr:cyclopropane-fatty-acyl-phospholipid synthase family protein [Shewanella avicenniae]QSX34573.1 class I SAM-dependent methyltransferase [Shewanella avicenniae]
MQPSEIELKQPVSWQLGWRQKLARSVLFNLLQGLSNGAVTLVEGHQRYSFGDASAELRVTMTIVDPSCYQRLVFGGSIGAAEAYIMGQWHCDDLTALVRIFARNLKLLQRLEQRFSWITNGWHLLRHRFSRNSVNGSKRNILAHYDLGNSLYEQFLDDSMLYSSAIYPHPDTGLAAAQQHKLQLICERLDLKPGQRVLEIGTGWGALAIYAAQHFGVHVTTTTISDAQHQYAKARIEAAGLTEQISLLKQDYRKLEGQYDRIVSIEMIEAVGHEYLPGFFNKLNSLLLPHGKLLLQAITIADQRYDSYRRGVDFIQRYIFPGGCLPSVSVMAQQLSQHSDMVIDSLYDFGFDYAKTLNDWQQRFVHALAQVKQLGYGEDFIRMWRFYLSYCEGGFLERTISVVHVTAAKPDYRPQ